ncbi:MAG: beta-lactamase regulating signal transducer with metallopeptidase domain [Verrucomicrobiales bacterium]|jgi:beta-lactamase regulating signal transducer with metallopeptidase domain
MGLSVTAVVALPLIPLTNHQALPAVPTAILETAGSIAWLPWIAGIWIVGAIWFGSRLLIGSSWLRRLCARAEEVELPAEVLKQLGKLPRGCRIVISDEAGVPFACGLLRRTIVLPRASSCWPQSRLVQVLAHEIHHHRAGDVWLQTLSHGICAALWWNPLVWLLMREWQREREFAADRAVLEVANPASYAENLLELSTRLPSNGRSFAAALYMTKRGVLETRIRRLLSKPENPGDARRWLAAGVISAIFIAMPICVAWAPLELAKKPSPELQQEIQTRLTADPFPGN